MRTPDDISLRWPEPTDLTDHDLDAAIDRADPAELLRWIDGHCAAREWRALATLRDRCVTARWRGRQLGGVAAHAEYRLALEAPALWVAPVLIDGTARGAPGPVAEVAGQRIAWVDVADSLTPGPVAGLFAVERVLEGDTDALDDSRAHDWGGVIDAPWHPGAWEPPWLRPRFTSDGIDDPAPPWPMSGWSTPAPAPSIEIDPDGHADVGTALSDLVSAWHTESNGRTDAVAVNGDAASAVAALGPRQTRLSPIDPATALTWLGWAGASGGAHGARRGRAVGRARALWTVAVLGGAVDDWPMSSEDLGAIAAELRWWLWDAGEPAEGWWLRLAVEDPDHGWSAAMAATDHD